MKKITREHIKALRVPVPPMEMQNLVSQRFSDRMSSVARLQTGLEVEKATVESLPPGFLRHAFKGEL
jgi:hypothetical protein